MVEFPGENMRKRNNLLDAVKALLALGVVFAHYQFPGYFGKIMGSFGTMGVIVFFLITGYQSSTADGSSPAKLLVRAKRNLIITAVAFAVYFIYSMVSAYALGTSSSYWEQYKDPYVYLKAVYLMNFSFIRAGHLWFMVNLLICYPILYLMEKYRLQKIFYWLLPLLLIGKITVEIYISIYPSGEWFDYHAGNIFLFGGLPIVILGSALRRYKELTDRVPIWPLLLSLAASFGLLFLTVCLKVDGADISMIFKITTGSLLLLCCLRSNVRRPVPVLGYLGRYCPVYVYLYHHLVGYTVRSLNSTVWPWPEFAVEWLRPLLVAVLSFLLAYLISLVLRSIGRKRENPGLKAG